jgi:hypothetical protein
VTARDTALDKLVAGSIYDANVHALLYVGDQIAALREALDTPSVNVTALDAAVPLPPQWQVRDPKRAARLAMTYTGRDAGAADQARAELTLAEQAVFDAARRLEDANIAVAQAQAAAQTDGRL